MGHSQDVPRASQLRAKRRGWPFWPGASIFLTGEEGAGKTVLARSILSKIDPLTSPDELPPKSLSREDYKFRLLQHERGSRLRVQLTVAPDRSLSSDALPRSSHLAGGRPGP